VSIVCRSQVISVYSLVINGGLSISAARGVLNRKLRRRSIARPRFPISVPDIHYLSITHHSIVISVFSIVDYGGIAISSARGPPRPEVTSPNDGATMVSY
jgi:hypothetical protein